jgi:energy-converting hydrogenase A subunit M
MEKPLGQIEGFTEKEISIFVESGRHNFYQSDVFKTFLEEKNIDVEEIDSLVVSRKIISDTEELCFEHTPYQFRK